MTDERNSGDAGDPYDPNRFVQAQMASYEQALHEIQRGRKSSHWMQCVFPQLDGLGFSATSRRYSIKSTADAAAYLAHPVLGPRLEACATLFACASPAGSVFHRLLHKYFEGKHDRRTLALLGIARGGS